MATARCNCVAAPPDAGGCSTAYAATWTDACCWRAHRKSLAPPTH